MQRKNATKIVLTRNIDGQTEVVERIRQAEKIRNLHERQFAANFKF